MKFRYTGTRLTIVNGTVVLPGEVIDIDPRMMNRMGSDFMTLSINQEPAVVPEPEIKPETRRRSKKA
jgi:hypothetical protein